MQTSCHRGINGVWQQNTPWKGIDMKFEDLTQDQCIEIARVAGLGTVLFIERVALNSGTGKPMTVGYVDDHIGNRALFCKRHSGGSLYTLCNEYRELAFM